MRRLVTTAGAVQPLQAPLGGGVQFGRLDDLVDQQPRVGLVGLDTAAPQHDLPGDPAARQTSEPEVGRPGHDALLGGGQAEVGVGSGEHLVEDEQQLRSAADGEGVHGRHPRLLDRAGLP